MFLIISIVFFKKKKKLIIISKASLNKNKCLYIFYVIEGKTKLVNEIKSY
jgi:hypothetical protein